MLIQRKKEAVATLGLLVCIGGSMGVFRFESFTMGVVSWAVAALGLFVAMKQLEVL